MDDSNIPQQSKRPWPVFNIGLLSILRIKRKRRKTETKTVTKKAYVVAMDEYPLSYQVY